MFDFLEFNMDMNMDSSMLVFSVQPQELDG